MLDPAWTTTRYIDGAYATFSSLEPNRKRGIIVMNDRTYLLCFSVGKRKSLSYLKRALEDRTYQSAVVVGIHYGPDSTRVVSVEKGMELAEMYGLPYFEVDLTTGCNIEELFYWIGKQWVQ